MNIDIIVLFMILILSVVGVAMTYKGGVWYLFSGIALLAALRLLGFLG